MSARRASSLLGSWDTIRCELLNRRICDLNLEIRGSRAEKYVKRLYGELRRKGLRFFPKTYLTDDWSCPDRVPIIGIPFYLADERLARIEEEQTGTVEDDRAIMALMRHEAGHAYNYAYRLWTRPGWTETFGRFQKPYRESFRVKPLSRQFVRHLDHDPRGRIYAQKHPDEDFAETFAVWLTPRSSWRRRYRLWPALRKLKYVDDLMESIRGERPVRTDGPLCRPVERMKILLAAHYGRRAERARKAADGYVDDELRKLFRERNGSALLPAKDLLRSRRADILSRIRRWSGLENSEAQTILSKLEERAEALGLKYPRSKARKRLLDVVSLASSMATRFACSGRFTIG